VIFDVKVLIYTLVELSYVVDIYRKNFLIFNIRYFNTKY